MDRRLLRKLVAFVGAANAAGGVGSVQHVRVLARLRTLAARCDPRTAVALAASMPLPERVVMEWRAMASAPARLDAIAEELDTTVARIKSAEKRLLELQAIHARMWRESSEAHRGGAVTSGRYAARDRRRDR